MQLLMLLTTYNILQCSCELLHLESAVKPFTPPTVLNPCSAVGTVFFLDRGEQTWGVYLLPCCNFRCSVHQERRSRQR